MLSKKEYDLVTKTWNRTAKKYKPLICLHEHFEKQVAADRNAIAVICDGERLTYGELNALCNRFAGLLMNAGVRRESLVGIHVQRGIKMLVALLGILKSGGAYVPLDPSYPIERLNFILEDSRAALLINDATTQNKLDYRGQTLNIDENWSRLAVQNSENPNLKIKPSNLAYVIYTSGSTGRPKGVCITHSNASTLLCWSNDTYSLQDLKCVLAATSISFDLSIFEMFAPLAKGGMVLLAENILELPTLAGEGITLVNTVPSALTEILRSYSLPSSVRVVNLAGEPLLYSLVKKVHEHENVRRVINLYGPSEDTTYSTIKEISRDEREDPTIGRPISNTKIYILGDDGVPVGIGETGEIYIAGDGVARGYLNNPELTAERFIFNRFSKNQNSKLYRTGDLARFLPNGEIQYIGRRDNQVKFRGFRVEPEEVEKNINRFESIRESAVAVSKDADGIGELLAFLVIRDEAEFSVDSLRGFLNERLPPFMIPSIFLSVDRLPRTDNGKIARKELVKLKDGGDRLTNAEFISAETPIQKKIARIFGNILGIDRVGLSDDFFLLGGHSLSAIRLVGQIEKNFEVKLPFSAVFENPTVFGLANLIDCRKSAPDSVRVRKSTNISSVGTNKRSFPVTVAQERMWHFHNAVPQNPVNNISAVWRFKEKPNVSVLKKSISEVIKRQPVFRTKFANLNGEVRQIVLPYKNGGSDDKEPDFSVIGLKPNFKDENIYEFIKQDVYSPFDLTSGNLLRVRLLEFAENDFRLTLTTHHIVSDGWSLEILLHELITIYESLTHNKKTPLKPLKNRYTDFAVWQTQWLKSTEIQKETTYWLEKLSGIPENLALPVRRPSTVRKNFLESYKGDYIEFRFDKKIVAAAARQCRMMNTTLFVYFLTCFYALLSYYAKQTDIVVGINVAGRSDADFENVIGLFTNHLALRAEIDKTSRFFQQLEKIKNTLYESYEHQHLPFNLLLHQINPVPKTFQYALSPPYQVKFVYDNQNQNMFKLLGIDEKKFEKDLRVKLDIILHVFESEGETCCRWIYNAELFTAFMAEQMSNHYKEFAEKTALLFDEKIIGLLEGSKPADS